MISNVIKKKAQVDTDYRTRSIEWYYLEQHQNQMDWIEEIDTPPSQVHPVHSFITVSPCNRINQTRAAMDARIRIFDAYFKTLTHEHWPALGQNRETKGIVLSNIREKWQWNDDKSRFPAPRVSSIENFPPIFIFLLDTGYILSYFNLWLFVVNMQRSTFVHSKYLLKKFRVPRLMFRSNSRMKAPDNSGDNFFKRFDNCF